MGAGAVVKTQPWLESLGRNIIGNFLLLAFLSSIIWPNTAVIQSILEAVGANPCRMEKSRRNQAWSEANRSRPSQTDT